MPDQPVQAALLEQLLDHRAVLARELAGARSGSGLVDRLDRDVQRAARAGAADADAGAGQAADDERLEAVAELAGVLDPGDGADAGVTAVGPGNEHEAAVAFAWRPAPRRGPRRSRARS